MVRSAAGTLVALLLLVGGCQSGQRAEVDGSRQFRQHLEASTEAVREAELDRARAHLRTARAAAIGPDQRRQVRSMEQLIEGAEALLEGRIEQTRMAWSRIEDPALREEVHRKARAVGLVVPAMAWQEEVR